jgi:hypothetical protein
MSVYAQSTDCVDPALTVSTQNLNDADVYVNLALGGIGVIPAVAATIPLPNATLTAIASAWALHLAAIEGSMGESSVLMSKAEKYRAVAESLVKKLNRIALGLKEPEGTGYGTVKLHRG